MSHGNIPQIPLKTVRVLVTGAGGPAAVSVMKSLSADSSVHIIAADMDPWAAGLYLVPPAARTLLRSGDAPIMLACRGLSPASAKAAASV